MDKCDKNYDKHYLNDLYFSLLKLYDSKHDEVDEMEDLESALVEYIAKLPKTLIDELDAYIVDLSKFNFYDDIDIEALFNAPNEFWNIRTDQFIAMVNSDYFHLIVTAVSSMKDVFSDLSYEEFIRVCKENIRIDYFKDLYTDIKPYYDDRMTRNQIIKLKKYTNLINPADLIDSVFSNFNLYEFVAIRSMLSTMIDISKHKDYAISDYTSEIGKSYISYYLNLAVHRANDNEKTDQQIQADYIIYDTDSCNELINYLDIYINIHKGSMRTKGKVD